MGEETPTTFAAKLILEGHTPEEVKAIMEQRNMNYPSVADVLNEFMSKKKRSVDELSEKSGVNSVSIQRIMNRQRNPSRNILLRIAMALSLSVEETQVLLKSGNCTTLSASRDRDLIIMDAIIHGKNYDDVNELLVSKDMPVLKESFKYYAFISYSHKDKETAQKLQKWLEHYHLPSKVLDDYPDIPQTLSPVFIDESDLVAIDGGLVDSLKGYLNESNYLIVICSPSSAQSKYVNEEVKYFIKELNRTDHIIPLIIEGTPNSKDSATECFPPAILELPYEHEPLGIDINVHKERGAFLRVVATLLKLNIDYFVSREEEERLREEKEKEKRRKARKKKRIIAFSLIAAALVIIAVILMPPSYDETLADNIMESSVAAYVRAGNQYESLRALTDTALNNPKEFINALHIYRNQISFAAMSDENSLLYLSDMMKTEKVMPWSGLPMNHEACEELLILPVNREDEYKNFADVLEFVMTDDYARKYYGSEYPKLLRELLDVDADISSELYQIVCVPHITGKYADDSPSAKGVASLFSSVAKQNEHLTGENAKQSAQSLTRLKGSRDKCIMNLNLTGAFEAYNKHKE